jgi:hypothetical protein
MATRIWTKVAMNRIHYLRRIGRPAAAAHLKIFTC